MHKTILFVAYQLQNPVQIYIHVIVHDPVAKPNDGGPGRKILLGDNTAANQSRKGIIGGHGYRLACGLKEVFCLAYGILGQDLECMQDSVLLKSCQRSPRKHGFTSFIQKSCLLIGNICSLS